MTGRLPLLFSILVLAGLCVHTATAEARFLWWGKPGRVPGKLQHKIEFLAGDSLEFRIHVIRLQDAKVLWQKNANIPTAPASLCKLLTVATALEQLPESTSFQTHLMLEQSAQADSLCLHIDCGGNPELGDSTLVQAIHALLRAVPDTTKVGTVLTTGRYDLRRMGPGWMWDDGTGRWAARVSAATINENGVLFRQEPLQQGVLTPALVGSALGARQVGLLHKDHRQRVSRDWRNFRDSFVVPTYAGLNPGYCNVEHPDSLYARIVYNAISGSGLKQSRFPDIRTGVANSFAGEVLKEITLHSWPLSQLADSVLFNSWNLGAECLFQELAARRDSMGHASWESAGQNINETIQEEFVRAGLARPEFRQVDGSGMSRYNAVPLSTFSHLFVVDHKNWNGRLRSHNPGPGQGTLKGRFGELPGGIELRAKTGTLRGRSLIAGVLFHGDSESGTKLDVSQSFAFSISLEGYLGSAAGIRDIQDSIIVELAQWLLTW